MATAEGTYTQFWSYDTRVGRWQAGQWMYNRGVRLWVYNNGQWDFRSAYSYGWPLFSNSSTVYIWARTYSASEGWQAFKMGRCINGFHYNGW